MQGGIFTNLLNRCLMQGEINTFRKILSTEIVITKNKYNKIEAIIEKLVND